MAEMKLLIPVLRALDAGVSGSAAGLARHLHVPRARVTAALAEAHELGVPLVAQRGRGYSLARRIDWLDTARVLAAMGKEAAHADVRVLDRVGSTNDAIPCAADVSPGRVLVVTAELQDGGRGRRGRRWSSGVANALTFSMLWQVRERLQSLSAASLVVGVALRRALAELGTSDVRLKWPNDLLCTQGKLGGVLIEGVPERGLGVLVIGIGINVRVPSEVKSAIDQPIADVEDLGVVADRSTILGVCLRHLIEALMQFESEGFARLRREWLTHAAFLSQQVALRHGHGETEHGIMTGIDEDGALLLATPLGSKKIYSGDVSLRADRVPVGRTP